MKLYQNIAKFYDLLYSYRDYDGEAGFLENLVAGKESPRVLDVACGTGSHLKALRKRIPGAELTGVDLNQGMIDVAQSKQIGADLYQGDMKDFNLGRRFDLVYCLSSSIQYNLNEEELDKSVRNMINHSQGSVVFDLAFCKERWMEGYTNITTNANERYQVAELYTSHSRGGLSVWNPLYLIKDNETGEIDMHVDNHTIKLWGIEEIKSFLQNRGISFELSDSFQDGTKGVPIFILEGIKR